MSESIEYISVVDATCRASFTNVLDRMGDDVPAWIAECITRSSFSNLFDRYKVWSANVGAAQSGLYYKVSLDHRLREAPLYKSAVLKVINRLCDILSTIGRLIVAQEDVYSLEMLQEDGALDSGDDFSPDVDGDWAISDSSSESEPDLVPQNPRVGSASSRLRLYEGTDQRSQLKSLVDSLKLASTCLYKLPVRNLAPLARLKSSNRGMFDSSSLFHHFDTMYVQELFPLCEKSISIRLGRLITRRRYLLHYRQMHNTKLQRETVESSSAQALTSDRLASMTFGSDKPDDQQTLAESSVPAKSDFVQSTVKASTFDPLRAPRVDIDLLSIGSPSEAETSTSIATTRTGRELLPIPPRPKNADGQELEDFECPFCGLVVHVKLTAHSWRKHLIRDLEPYVCVGSDCENHESTYADRDEWFEHQLRHFSSYHCGDPGHQRLPDRSDFQRHMSQVHKIIMPSTEIFLRPIDCRFSFICPLCKEETSRIKQHLSRHLERIALFAIPRTVIVDDDGKFGSARANISRNTSNRSQSSVVSYPSSREEQYQKTLNVFSQSLTSSEKALQGNPPSHSQSLVPGQNDLDAGSSEDQIIEIPAIAADFSWEHIKPELGDTRKSKRKSSTGPDMDAGGSNVQTDNDYLKATLNFGSGHKVSEAHVFDGTDRRIILKSDALRKLRTINPRVHLILLDNCLLITKHEKRLSSALDSRSKDLEYYVVQTLIPLELLQLTGLQPYLKQKSLQVTCLGKDTVYEFQMGNDDDCTNWCENIIIAKTDHVTKTALRAKIQFELVFITTSSRVMNDKDSRDDPIQVSGTSVDVLMNSQTETGALLDVHVREEIETLTNFVASGTKSFIAGTRRGVYLINDKGQVWQHVKLDSVHQISIEDNYHRVLCLSNNSIYCCDIADLEDAKPHSVTPYVRLSTGRQVQSLRTVYLQDHPLVFYSWREGLSTAFQVLEPSAEEERPVFKFGLSQRRPGRAAKFRDFDEFYIPTLCDNINFFTQTLSLATKEGFEILTLDQKQPWSVPNLRADDESTQKHLDSIAGRLANRPPLSMFRLSTPEFICCYVDCAIYINQSGDVSRSVIMEFISRADNVAISNDFLIIFHTDFIEIRDTQTGKLAQVIENVDIKMLDAGHDSTFPPDDKRAYKRTVKFRMRCPGQANKYLVVALSPIGTKTVFEGEF